MSLLHKAFLTLAMFTLPVLALGCEVETDSSASFTPVAIATPAPVVTPECLIKGNTSFESGEKIYHMPGDPYYAATTIEPEKGERMFCTEAEAQAAGWRKQQASNYSGGYEEDSYDYDYEDYEPEYDYEPPEYEPAEYDYDYGY